MFNPEKFDWSAFQKNLPPIGAGQEFEIHTGRATEVSIFNATDTLDKAKAMVEMYRGLAGRGTSNPPQARKNTWKIIHRDTREAFKTYSVDSL